MDGRTNTEMVKRQKLYRVAPNQKKNQKTESCGEP